MKSSVASMAARPARIGLKKETIVDIISALFILLFLYTAISKSYEIGKTQAVLYNTPVLKNFALEAAWGIVIIEYIVSVLLFFPKTKRTGLYSSFTLMLAFTIYIALMMAFSPDLPCSCGGIISKMTWTQHLIFNIIFSALAFIAIRLYRKSGTKTNPEIMAL
jgi:hypothetical protein